MHAPIPLASDELVHELARLRLELAEAQARLAALETRPVSPSPLDDPHTLLATVFPVAEVLSAVSLAVVAIDAERVVRGINSHAQVMLGYTLDEVCGQLVETLLSSTAVERFGGVIRSFLDSPKHAISLGQTTGDVTLRRRDGTTFPADVLIVRSGVPPYSRLYTAVVIRDVTVEMRDREALRRSETRLGLTLQAARAGIWQRNLQTGESNWSDGIFLLLGYEPGSIEPSYENWISRVHPDDRHKAQTALAETSATTSTVVTEYRVVWPDGSTHWLRDMGRMEHGEDGRVQAISGVQFDITELAAYREHLEDLVAARTAELHQITGLHSAIVDNANLIIIATDHEGIIRTFNPTAERMLGYRADEVIRRERPVLFHRGHELMELGLNVEGLAQGVEFYDPGGALRDLQTGAGASREWTFVRKDGSTFPVLLSVSALRDPTGKLLGHVGLAADITQLKQAEQQLRYYASLQEAVHDAVIATDLKYRIQSWNKAAERLYGWRAEEVSGQVVTDILQTDYVSASTREDVRQQFQREGYWTGEVTQQRKDGSRLHLLASVAIVRDQRSVPIGVVAINHDITHLKQAEQALRESQERLQILFDQSPDALVLCRTDGVVIDINQACETLAGWPRADVREVHFADLQLMDATALTQAVTLMQQYRQGESNPAFDFTLYRRDRTAVEVEARVYPVTLSGQTHFLAAIRDITPRKQAEEQLRSALQQQAELNSLKSRFISMVSHEFRTPLATILATVESLSAYRQHMDSLQIERRLDKVREQVAYMRDMLNDVLMVAAMQANKVSLYPVAFSLDTLCRDILDEMRPAEAARIHYTCSPPLLVVETDKKLMRQIVGNLLSNALKYSPDDRPVIFAVTGSERQVRVTVTDQGIGISDADQKHLFEPFHRGANVGIVSGSGLGMSIIRHSVEVLRGTIDVSSQLGQGTSVMVTLPRHFNADPAVD